VAKPYRESLAGCELVEKDHAVVVRFQKIFHEPRERLGFSVLPKHSFEGTAIRPDLSFSSRPIGSGPMKGSQGRQGVKFGAFPNAHHAPKIGELNLQEGGDPFVQVKTLVNGGVQGVLSVAPPLRPEVAASDDVALKSYDLRSWWFIAVNTNRGPLKSKPLRQALGYTLDRSELRELTIGVEKNDPNPPCEFVSGPFVQSSPYYNRQVKVVERSDRARAKQLMEQAGASLQAGRWVHQGQPISLK